ncbi:hypothetical protein ANN_25031 [Periplaneta americana]|uniref:B box-type domain-containing protein n=1 Tax=Periplaneta americana TaxID=6978 RepID=A0ABQ8S099_PERAM|nr:hypothetical protein ANN_25031 [Periplaneta americana]
MATKARKSVSVLDSGFPRFVNSIIDESEGSYANGCEDENDPDYNSEHDTDSEQDYDSNGVDEDVNQPNDDSLNIYGTMRKNKKDIPQEFQADRKRKVGSTEYGLQNDRTLISHVPKKGKSVILLSSMHHSTSFKDYIPISRFGFLKTLGRQLTEPYLHERLVNDRLPKELRMIVSSILKEPLPKNEETREKSKRKRCALCPRSKEKETNQYCVSCDRPVCHACRSVTCRECGE